MGMLSMDTITSMARDFDEVERYKELISSVHVSGVKEYLFTITEFCLHECLRETDERVAEVPHPLTLPGLFEPRK